MSIVVNLRYTGVNGNAAKFAQEMEQSGTADLIRADASESGVIGPDGFRSVMTEWTGGGRQ